MKNRAIFATAATLFVVAMFLPAWAQHAEYYVLDGFGGVHSGDGAPAILGAPYFGFDIARDIIYVPVGTTSASGNALLILDGFGGVHAVGALTADPPVFAPPYFGFDIARGIARRDVPPRVAFKSESFALDFAVTFNLYAQALATVIYVPTDGYLIVNGSSYMSCSVPGASNNLSARLTMNVGSTDDGLPSSIGFVQWNDCTNVLGYPTNSRTLSHVFPVTAGQHTVYLLVRKVGGTGTLRLLGRTLNAQFIATDFKGDLNAVVPTPAATPDDPFATGEIIRR